MTKNIGKQAKSAFAWDLIGTLFKQISVLTVSVVLARLLSPEEFGIIGMAMVFINLSQVFIDIGFSQGLIQKQNNTQIVYSSVFFINILLGLIVAILIFLFAPLIGDFFESNEVTSVIKWLCLIPLISSLGGVHNAQLSKSLSFKKLTIISIISTVSGGVFGIVMAFSGYGVNAIVGQQISSVFFLTAMLWWKNNWKPSWEFSYKEIKLLLNFSGFVFLDSLLRRFFMQIDTLFIGKYFSAASLGFYSRADSLNKQISAYTAGSLQKVLFPTFSKIQNEPKLFVSSYFKVFELSAFFGALTTGCCFFLAEDIIITLLGNKWEPSILIFQILVFKTIFNPFVAITDKTLLAKGYSKEKFKLGQVRRLILLIPLYVGYLKGLIPFTISVVVAYSVAFLASLWVSQKYLNISFTKQLYKFLVPLFPLVFIIVLCYLFKIDTNSFLLFITFLIIQFFYLYIIKNESLYLLLIQIKNLKNKFY